MSKILVAEDTLSLHNLLRRTLGRGGHEVKLVANGAEALEILRAENFDVLITDVDMPHMDGFALIKTLPSVGFRGAVIVMTGMLDSDRTEKLEALVRAGHVYEFLGKPFEPAKLLEAVNRCVSHLIQRDRFKAQRDDSGTND